MLEMNRMTLCVKQRPCFCIALRSRVKAVIVKRVVVNGSLGRGAEVKRRRRGRARDTVCVSELLSSRHARALRRFSPLHTADKRAGIYQS